MASYDSYKKIKSDQIVNKSITTAHIADNVRDNFCTQWFYGNVCRCSPGKCCLWSVPSCTRRLVWNLWGAGGNGNGNCSAYRCHHTKPAGGGAWTSKSHETNVSCTYRVCSGGVYRCLSRECYGCNGCSSYVCGYNINACACGGQLACANTSWTDMCNSDMPYCVTAYCNCSGTSRGDSFTTYTHGGNFQGQSGFMYPGYACHCWKHLGHSTGAPGLTNGYYEQNSNYCWTRCGCWIAPVGMGGQSGTSNYCGYYCCGQGGTGGPGIVKVTFY